MRNVRGRQTQNGSGISKNVRAWFGTLDSVGIGSRSQPKFHSCSVSRSKPRRWQKIDAGDLTWRLAIQQ